MRFRAVLIAATLLFGARAFGQTPPTHSQWTVVLHAGDFIIGQPLLKLNTRHRWILNIDNLGEFEVAVKKSALPVSAPNCHMDYLVLLMPVYYPETPAQATLADRRAVYDALLSLKNTGRGSMTVNFDALWYAKQGPSGPELTSCNIYFTLPLTKGAAEISP